MKEKEKGGQLGADRGGQFSADSPIKNPPACILLKTPGSRESSHFRKDNGGSLSMENDRITLRVNFLPFLVYSFLFSA